MNGQIDINLQEKQNDTRKKNAIKQLIIQECVDKKTNKAIIN